MPQAHPAPLRRLAISAARKHRSADALAHRDLGGRGLTCRLGAPLDCSWVVLADLSISGDLSIVEHPESFTVGDLQWMRAYVP